MERTFLPLPKMSVLCKSKNTIHEVFGKIPKISSHILIGNFSSSHKLSNGKMIKQTIRDSSNNLGAKAKIKYSKFVVIIIFILTRKIANYYFRMAVYHMTDGMEEVVK